MLKNFVLLQFSGDRLWYYRKVTPGSVDSGFSCVVQRYASPVGNISPITIWAVDSRSVHNIICFYTANCEEVNRHKMYDGIAVHVVGWAIFDMALYCGLTVINCKVFQFFIC